MHRKFVYFPARMHPSSPCMSTPLTCIRTKDRKEN